MNSEILKSVKGDLETREPKIEEAEELIATLKEVGEDTREMETQLRTLKIRRDKWKKVLIARGY